MATRTARAKQGWVPQQHGAWAMLAVPTLFGAIARCRTAGPTWDVAALALTWFLGYFAFAAASLWLKAAPRRRRRYLPPVLVYGAATLAGGIAVLTLCGPGAAWWLAVFGPLVFATLLLVWQRQERSLASGLLTVVAASMFALTVYRPALSAVVGNWSAPDVVAQRWCVIVCFLYFLGTVFAVKTMIRERNSQGWFAASVLYHLAAVAVAWVGVAVGRLSWPWIVFFAVAAVRAVVLPLAGPRRGRSVRPGTLGIIEVVFTAALVILTLSLGPLA